jgi:hypothetical protein
MLSFLGEMVVFATHAHAMSGEGGGVFVSRAKRIDRMRPVWGKAIIPCGVPPDRLSERRRARPSRRDKRGGTLAHFWRKSSVRKDLMLELVDDLSREYAK